MLLLNQFSSLKILPTSTAINKLPSCLSLPLSIAQWNTFTVRLFTKKKKIWAAILYVHGQFNGFLKRIFTIFNPNAERNKSNRNVNKENAEMIYLMWHWGIAK